MGRAGGMKAVAVVLALFGAMPALAQDDPLVPARRAVLAADTDLPGGDLDRIFDVTLETCIEVCLRNADCDSLTYNQRSRACFPKGGSPAAQPFAGALSGHVEDAGAREALARQRADAVAFLRPEDLRNALDQARRAAADWPPGLDADPAATARAAEARGDWQAAIAAIGPLVAQRDRAADWLALAGYASGWGDQDMAARAAINAYLRAGDDAEAGQALAALARAWDSGRGRDSLAALRVAATLNDAEDIAEALARAEERHGMRVVDNRVNADLARPDLCIDFSRPLSESLDYTPYLRLPPGDLTVEASDAELCIAGFAHGAQVAVTLRAGLPAEDGEALREDVTVEAYIRDRAPSVRFPGRAYLLPSTGDRGIEVVTVNADALDLRLSRVSDRNLIASLRDDLFARPLDGWSASWLRDQMATEVWRGAADLAEGQMNRETATRLGIPDAAGPLEPGIYVLEARLPGTDPGEVDYSADAVPMAIQWFVVSDFGISTLWGADGLVVVVRGLSDAGAREGVEVALISRANAVLALAQTDAQGVARFDGALVRGEGGAAPAMVTVTDWQGEGADRAPRDMAFLSLLDPEFDLSDRGVAGLPAPGPVDVFLATDRGVYRAGEVVHVTALARDGTAQAVRDLPLIAVLTRPDGVEASRQRLTPDEAGGYVFDLPIDGFAPRGTWRLEMRAAGDGPALAFTRLLVEDFAPERIDFSLDLPEGPLPGGSDLTVAGNARWLFGAPAADLPWQAWLGLAPGFALADFPSYAFGVADGRTAGLDSIGSGVTAPDGGFAVPVDLPEAEAVTEATLRVQVSEGAGRPVERRETRILMPGQPVLGIRKLFDGDTVAEGSEARFDLIAVAPDMSRAATPARWTLTRLETDYIWYRSGSRWNWEVVTHRRRVTGGEVQVGADAPAPLSVSLNWGQYELRVEAPDGTGAAAVTFWSGWAMAGAGSESPDRLAVRLDAPAYRAGDTARLTIEAEEAGIATVSVLTNRIVELQTVALAEGANEVTLTVTEDWGAGAYVTAQAIRPLDGGAENRAPVRRLGLAYAPVDPGARKLDARIEVATESRPRGTLPVTLHLDGVQPGQTAFASIAVVDQGILNLTGFKSPDPAGHYFGQHRLGVALRDLYGRLLLSTGAPDGALREGGDAQGGLDGSAPPPTEVLMAHFSGPLTVGEDGSVTVDVPIPDFNGAVRVMALAWTETAIGQAEADAVIRDPVVLVVTAPQFLAPGDTATLQLALTQTEGAGETRLSLDAGGLETGALPEAVTLAEGEVRHLTLPVTVPPDAALGVAYLGFALTAPDGTLLSKDIAIPIMDGAPEVVRRSRIGLDANATETLDGTDSGGLRNVSRILLTAGPLASLDTGSVMGDLWRYPYGCTEQLASAALPLIRLPLLVPMVLPDSTGPAPFDAGEAVDSAIARILTRQNAEGGFGLWAAGYDGDRWLDAYVTDFLSQARAAGYAVPERAFQSALTNLRNAMNYATSPTAGDEWENANLAYGALVLARERAASVGDLRYYADAAGDRFTTPLSAAQLGAALALYGDNARGQAMMARALAALKDADKLDRDRMRWDYGSALRDRAGVLALAVEAGLEVPDMDAQVRKLAEAIDQRRARGWNLSTQESGALVQLSYRLMQAPPALSLDGVALAEVIAPLLPGADVVLETGDRPVDVTLTAFGRLAADAPAGGTGYAITREYFDMDGQPLDIAHLPLGTRMAVVLTVTPDLGNPGGRLIIDDPLPAGFEIDNPDLIQSGSDGAELFGESVDPDMAQFLRERFLAGLTWQGSDSFQLVYIVRAVHEGRFTHPAAVVEDMYRPQFRAWTDAGTVEIGG